MDITELDAQPRDGEGTEQPAPGRHLLIWVTLALACLVGGFFVVKGGPADAPVPQPLSTSAQPALPPISPGSNQLQYLGVNRICGAITNHKTTLAISFEVQNVSPYDVDVRSVTSVLPLGGLKPGRFTAGGDCVAPGTAPVAGPIAAQRSQYYTLNFTLPKTCPAPYPVLVRINFQALGFDQTNVVVLESDLSVPDFDSCPKTPKAAQAQRGKPPQGST